MFAEEYSAKKKILSAEALEETAKQIPNKFKIALVLVIVVDKFRKNAISKSKGAGDDNPVIE